MSNPYEKIFGPDKKTTTTGQNQKNQPQQQYGQQPYAQNQQYGQYQNQQPPQFGQYPNQQGQQPYNQYPNHQQQYGQYQNQQQSYGQYPDQQGQQPYAQNQPPYGQNQNNQQYGQYSPNQQQPPQYGQNPNQQPPQSQYGQYPPNQQPPQYGQNQPPQYGQNQPPQYGQIQPPQYGQIQPPQYGQNTPPQYGQNPPPQYGQNQPPQYGQNQQQGYSQNQYPNQPPLQPYGQNQNQPQNNQQQPYDQNLNRQQTQPQQPLNQQNTLNNNMNNQYAQQPMIQQNNLNTVNTMNSPYAQVQQQLPPLDQSKIDADAAALRKAMKGLGTDEKAIIKIIAHRTNRERLAMIDSFKRQFNRDLIKDLKSELSGNFENATLALFQDPITYDCWSLKKAMKGLGTNEDTLIEILATRPNYYINEIKRKYLKMHGKSLEQDLTSDLSGDLKKVMLTLASAFRSENQNPDRAECHDKAEQLYKAGEKRLGTNEKVFYDILTKASGPELVLIDKIYEQNHKHGLIKAIDKEFSGNMKKLLQTIVAVSINPPEYFATRVKYAIQGLGTKDTLLIRILVTRHELDLPKIKEAYKRLYNKDMVKDIEKDTSGDYKRLLVELCS